MTLYLFFLLTLFLVVEFAVNSGTFESNLKHYDFFLDLKFFLDLGNNPTAKTIYKTLMTVKKQQQPHSSLPDLEDLNKYFASIGSILSSNLPKVTNSDTIQQVENTMVVYPTNASEVTSIIKKIKNKKSCGEERMVSVTRY